MINIKVTADISKAQSKLKYLRNTAVRGAASRALNRAIEKTRAEARRRIAAKRALPLRALLNAMKIQKATRGTLEATLTVSGRPITLRTYGAREVGRRTKIRRNAHGQFAGGGGKAASVMVTPGQRKTMKDAFIGPNGQVFRRLDKRRLPIRKLMGPSVPTAISSDAVQSALELVARKAFEQRFAHEFAREIAKADR